MTDCLENRDDLLKDRTILNTTRMHSLGVESIIKSGGMLRFIHDDE